MDRQNMKILEETAVPPVKIDLGAILWDLVDSGKYEDAIAEITNEKYRSFLFTNSMDLIPVLTLKLQDSPNYEAQECLEAMLMHVASVAKVKEVMIVLLEEVQTFRSQEVYRVMLKPMQVALSRIISTECSPTLFTWTFKSVIEHLGKMDLPSGYNLEGKERLLLEADPAVQALSDNLYHVLEFFKVFYNDIILGKLIFTKKIICTKLFMAKSMLRLFDKPLTFLDIYCTGKDDENRIHRTAAKLISMIIRLTGNPIKFFSDITAQSTSKNNSTKLKNNTDEYMETCEDDGDYDLSGAVSQTCLATFYYCIFHQHMSINSIPCVYNPQHKFLSCLPLISQLLAKTEHLAIHKGLLLAQALIDNIDTGSVTANCLNAPYHYQFNKLLVGSMTMIDNKELRITALQLFRKYISNFELNGRYRLFESLLQSVTHVGVLGFIISEIKENIALSLQEKTQKQQSTSNEMGSSAPISKFTGQSLWKLVYLACTIPDGERTDMLDWSEKILAELNLILFLFIRANKVCNSIQVVTTDAHNKTKKSCELFNNSSIPMYSQDCTFLPADLLQHILHFHSELFTPLQRGLQISREHYELKLKSLSDSTKVPTDMEVQMSINDSILPGLSPKEEKEVIALALSRFDLINCVLARVEASADELMITCKQIIE